jgi:hypothetical protein
MIRNLREGPEGLKQQTLGIIATMTREVASGTRGTQTMTLPSGMQVTAHIKLPCDYSQKPLQFFNDLERLKTDGLITDEEYGQLQAIKSELAEKQTKFTNALANAKALETVKQELEMASKQTYLPKGSPTYDAISSILSQRSQLPAELQSYWNDFSYESLEADLQRAQDLHKQKIDQKAAQLEQLRADQEGLNAKYPEARTEFLRLIKEDVTLKEQYRTAKEEFLAALNSCPRLSDAQKTTIREKITEDGFPVGSIQLETILTSEADRRANEALLATYNALKQHNPQARIDLFSEGGFNVESVQRDNSLSFAMNKNRLLKDAYTALLKCNPQSINQKISGLEEELKELRKNEGTTGLRPALMQKSAQMPIEQVLYKMGQVSKSADFAKLRQAVEFIATHPLQTEKGGGLAAPGKEFKACEDLLEDFAKQIGIKMGKIGKINEPEVAKDLLNFINIAEHMKTHNSAQDIHRLALDVIGVNTFSEAPDSERLNVIFVGYGRAHFK